LKAYYGSRIGPNRTRTPEGFLICHNTPIGRTGSQEYMPCEVGLKGSDFIQIERLEEDVFEPVAMASFEGKPVTDDHPPDDVTPENAGNYVRGVTTNVRRGGGDEADLLLADLIIYDAILISEIEAGKREVSCGYNYNLAETDGGYRQTGIRGNHVAIVRNGRAGPRVQVKDEMPQQPKKERGKTMDKNKNTIWGKMLSAFARDAEPEELAEASKMMQADTEPAAPPAAAPPQKQPPAAEPAQDDDPNAAILQELLGAVKSLQAEIAALKAAPPAADEEPPESALDELEKELGQDAEPDGEETGTVGDEAPVSDPSSRPDNPIPGADSKAAILLALKAVRPIVAGIQDPAERKKAADQMAKTFKEQLKVAPTHNYRKLAQPAKSKTAKDKEFDEREIGRRIAKKFNPHYKNRD